MIDLVNAITLTQPWATLVAILAKRLETRSWPTNYRGRLLVTAAKGFPQEARELCMEEPFYSVLKKAGYLRVHETKATDLPLASVVAACWLTNCQRVEVVREAGWPTDTTYEPAFGNYDDGRFAFTLDRVQKLATPIPCRGKLGIWVPPSELVQSVREQLRAA